MKRFVFDIDGTICDEKPTFEKCLAKPKKDVIDIINDLYSRGNFIILYTARGWAEYKMTKKWLESYEVSHDLLLCGKPIYDVWVDDRSLNVIREYNILKELKNG